MKNKTLFDYGCYRKYLDDYFKSLPARSGKKSQAAQKMKIHATFLSQVLSGLADLSLEQAFLCADFLNLLDDEKKFFLALVNFERAGTHELKQFFKQELVSMQLNRRELTTRLVKMQTVSQENQAIFYSNWNFQVVHALVSIPSLRTREALAKYLRLSHQEIESALNFLQSIGLLTHQEGEYRMSENNLHLSGNSPFIASYHTQWRLKATEAIRKNQPTDLHYSAIMTMSAEDAEKCREKMLQAITEVVQVVKASPEEVARGVVIDFFDIHGPGQ